MDRAYGAACGAGAEWQFGGRAGGSDQRVRYADAQQAGPRESSPGQTGTCGSPRSTPTRSPRSTRRRARSTEFADADSPTPARWDHARALTATSGSPSSPPTRSARSTRAPMRSPSSRSRPPPRSRSASSTDPTGTSGSRSQIPREQDRRDQPHNARDHRVHRANLRAASRSASPSGPDGNIWFTEKDSRARSPVGVMTSGYGQRSASSRRRPLRARPTPSPRARRHPLVHRAGERVSRFGLIDPTTHG